MKDRGHWNVPVLFRMTENPASTVGMFAELRRFSFKTGQQPGAAKRRQAGHRCIPFNKE
jgi:hypothetical protein